MSIVYQGEVAHRDSTGASGRLGPGDVQWMTAASGILHEEFHTEAFTRKGGTLEIAQLWVNLPARYKMSAPAYQTLLDKEIPAIDLPEQAGVLRVIAGDYGGHKGPARAFTPIDIWDLRLRVGKTVTLNLPEGHTLAVVVLSGTVTANGEQIAREAQTILFDREGGGIALEARDDAKLLVLSGEPIDEPIAAQGPFVMNTAKEIRQAIADFQSGRIGAIAG